MVGSFSGAAFRPLVRGFTSKTWAWMSHCVKQGSRSRPCRIMQTPHCLHRNFAALHANRLRWRNLSTIGHLADASAVSPSPSRAARRFQFPLLFRARLVASTCWLHHLHSRRPGFALAVPILLKYAALTDALSSRKWSASRLRAASISSGGWPST